MKTTLDSTKTEEYIDKVVDEKVIPALEEFIKIPNLSVLYDKELFTNGYQEQAAQLLVDCIKDAEVQGLTVELLSAEAKTPLVFVEIEGSIDKTILMYGHYDKQPHLSGWAEGLGPTKPVIKNGKLYGRGGVDDGYAIFASLYSIRNLQLQGVPHPRIVILVEGSEESMSPDLDFYLKLKEKEIGSPDMLICFDSGAGNYDQLWVTQSLRGCAMLELTVKGLAEGVHSGLGGGIAPDTFSVLRHILDKFDDSKNQVFKDILRVEIPETRQKEMEKTVEVLGEDVLGSLNFREGVKMTGESYLEVYTRNLWEPHLTVIGIDGVPSVAESGNFLRPETKARLSFRLPPSYLAKEAVQEIEKLLLNDIPFGCKAEISGIFAAEGWSNKDYSQRLTDILDSSSEKFFGEGKKCLAIGIGGSIPFIKTMADTFKEADIIVAGIIGPGANAHSVNENLDIPYLKKVICAYSHVIGEYFN